MNAPAQDLLIESAVLGAILLERDAIYTAMQILKTGNFYMESHNIIFDAILKLNTQRKPIDILTVTDSLRKSGKLETCGGAYYISKLTSGVGSAAHIEDHCRILYQLYLRREMIAIGLANIKKIDENPDKDIFEVYNSMSAEMNCLFELALSSDFHNMKDVMGERLTEISEIKQKENGIVGVDTGFPKLNNLTSGFQPGDFVIIGARPSMGKTIISLLNSRACVFRSNKKVAYFSLEMSRKRIADRLLSIESVIESKKISSNNLTTLEWETLDNSVSLYTNKNFFIIDVSALTIEDIKSRAITLHRKYGIDEIIIDYIQLIKHSFPRMDTNYNVAHISRNIKSIAKEIGCPVIALSQLNRSGTGEPVMKDLRDSGSLEQDADIVWFLHRNDYEGQECEEEDKNRIINIIAKHRNGDIGKFLTYRNDNWSYIGEMPFEEMQSLESSMPYSYMQGIEEREIAF